MLIGNAFERLQFVHHECHDLGFLEGMWTPPCPHGEGKKQETMSFKGWKKFQFIWWKEPFFFVLFLFFCFILCTEERSTVGLQQSCFVCQGKKLGDGMVWELPHPMLEWQDGLSFLPLVAKKILVNQMSIWPERNGDVRNWLWEEDSSYLSGQFLALAVTTVPGSVSQSRKKCVLVNWKVEVCYIYWLKLLVLNEKNDKR